MRDRFEANTAAHYRIQESEGTDPWDENLEAYDDDEYYHFQPDAKKFSTEDFSSDDDEEEKFDEIQDKQMQLWKVNFKISLSHVSLTRGIPAINQFLRYASFQHY